MDYFLIPHPDDESANMIYSILESKEKRIVFLTNGTPNFSVEYFKKAGFYSREEYKKSRKREAFNAANILGFENKNILFLDINDQELHLNLKKALNFLINFARGKEPHRVHVVCYEGHHADHESSRMIGWYFAKEMRAKLIEYSNNLVRVDIKDKKVDKSNFECKNILGDKLKLRNYILKNIHKSQNIDLKRYKESVYFREAKNNNYSILKQKLPFENIASHRVNKKDLLSAFKIFKEDLD